MNLLMVFAFAGDSTMTRFLAIAERRTARRIPKIPRARIMRESGRPYQRPLDGAKKLRAVEHAEGGLSARRKDWLRGCAVTQLRGGRRRVTTQPRNYSSSSAPAALYFFVLL